MIPILYDTNETAFVSNGLCRLRDCISCVVTEERNGIYELDFEYPVTGANFDLIQVGRIVAVTHDDTGDVQPFDIVGYEKPIEGVVTFHCVHISYRQSYLTVAGANINSLSDAFTLLRTAQPSNPFSYQTDKTSTGFLAAADGIPRSVKEMLGGIEGSILDTYGGEFEWNKWNVYLHSARGIARDISIRYGVNMLEYNDEMDNSGSYASCVPYWTNGNETVVGNRTNSGGSTITGRGECVPLDLSDKFETKPTKTQLQNAAKSYMNANNTFLAGQTITVSFIRLQDMDEYADFKNLLTCRLCDTINVIFPDYATNGRFKIVKTVWNVLNKRYDEMELGSLSTSLAEALGVNNTLDRTGGGGGGGTNNYNDLSNKPSINSVVLAGNKSLLDLGINIPTITDSYDPTSSDGMSGKAVKSAIDGISIPAATTTTPLMDGEASVGSETTWAKGDHVHPSDTSKQDSLVSGTNIKTINNVSLLGSGDISVGAGVFIAEYNVTSFSDVKSAYDNGDIIICHENYGGDIYALLYSYTEGAEDVFSFTRGGAINTTHTLITLNDLGTWTKTSVDETDCIVAKGTSSGWLYRKWNSGKIELWANDTKTVSCTSAFASTGAYYSGAQTYNLPTDLGLTSVTHYFGSGAPGNQGWIMIASASTTSLSWRAYNRTSNSSCSVSFNFYVVGTYA